MEMRTPGVLLSACRVVFSRRDVDHRGRIPLGSTLHAGSNVRNSCYMKAQNFNTRRKDKYELLNASEELEMMAGACGSLEPDSVDEAKHSVRLKFLRRLQGGDFVGLEDGMEVYARARQEANMECMTKKSLREAVRGIMRETAANLADAEFVTYGARETGLRDTRTKYIMPLSVSTREDARKSVGIRKQTCGVRG